MPKQDKGEGDDSLTWRVVLLRLKRRERKRRETGEGGNKFKEIGSCMIVFTFYLSQGAAIVSPCQ